MSKHVEGTPTQETRNKIIMEEVKFAILTRHGDFKLPKGDIDLLAANAEGIIKAYATIVKRHKLEHTREMLRLIDAEADDFEVCSKLFDYMLPPT